MAADKKLTDNQVAALATFFSGASEILGKVNVTDKNLTLDEARNIIQVLFVGMTITAVQIREDASHDEIYGDGAPSLSDPPIHDTFDMEADVIDLQQYREKGGLLN